MINHLHSNSRACWEVGDTSRVVEKLILSCDRVQAPHVPLYAAVTSVAGAKRGRAAWEEGQDVGELKALLDQQHNKLEKLRNETPVSSPAEREGAHVDSAAL